MWPGTDRRLVESIDRGGVEAEKQCLRRQWSRWTYSGTPDSRREERGESCVHVVCVCVAEHFVGCGEMGRDPHDKHLMGSRSHSRPHRHRGATGSPAQSSIRS